MCRKTTISISANTSWYLYNFRKNTILELLNIGFDVIAIAPKDEYSIKLTELGCEYIDISIDQGGSNPIRDFKTFIDFFKIYKNRNISVSLNFTPKNNIYSTLAASTNGVKCINNIAGLGAFFLNNNLTSYVARILYRISQSKASKIFFQNEDDRRIFLEYKIVKESLTDRLPGSGVDLSRFSLTQSPDDGRICFLLVARMLFEKGILHYVEAARVLKAKYGNKVEFNLLGFLDVNNPSAVSSGQMESWENEGVVKYLGVSDKVETFMAKADCVVLPSYYREGVPKSLLEAGAMGKPIVTTNGVGCRDTVDEGINGFLCVKSSSDSLTSALDKFINLSYEQRLVMGKNSRLKVEREFDENIVIAKYVDAVRKCLEL